MHINFGGPLNNPPVKNHDLAMYVVSIWTATMNKTESTRPAIFPNVLLKLAPFYVLSSTRESRSALKPSNSTRNISTD